MKIIIKNGLFEYQAKVIKNPEDRKAKNHFFFKRTTMIDDSHLGEFLAYIIANKIGFKICDVELYKSPLFKPGKYDVGILSFVEKTPEERLINPAYFIDNYLRDTKSKDTFYYGVYDIDTILNSIFYEYSKNNSNYSEFVSFKQDLINMIVFDMKFANTDRNTENWLVRKNLKTGMTDLYPMFDNEAILGFDINLDENEEITRKQIEDINEKRELPIVTPAQIREGKYSATYEELLKYMLSKYPEMTENAIQDVNKISVKDLEQALEDIDGITDKRKKLALGLFIARSQGINKVYETEKERKKSQYQY